MSNIGATVHNLMSNMGENVLRLILDNLQEHFTLLSKFIFIIYWIMKHHLGQYLHKSWFLSFYTNILINRHNNAPYSAFYLVSGWYPTGIWLVSYWYPVGILLVSLNQHHLKRRPDHSFFDKNSKFIKFLNSFKAMSWFNDVI